MNENHEHLVVFATAVILALGIWAGVDSCRSTAEREHNYPPASCAVDPSVCDFSTPGFNP